MTSQPVPESLCNLLADVFDISPNQVTPELAVGSIEAWDSFGHLQAILAMEAEFRIQFDPARIPDLTTVALLLRELETQGVTFRK
jgi:acyl carrier protein